MSGVNSGLFQYCFKHMIRTNRMVFMYNMTIYKNKGSIDEPANYRGITLLSCTCKLLTACLNSILSLYVNYDILGREQVGFREGEILLIMLCISSCY